MTGVFSAITVLVGAGTAIYAGKQQEKLQKRALAAQREAQRESLLAAAGQERRAAYEENKLNQRKPDISSILFGEQQRGTIGPASTILTGGGGKSLLGSKSLLGG